MAFSSSLRKAQTVKLCDLCETEANLKWRCIQCDKCLCNKCKNIHSKVQMSIEHQIVDINMPFQDVEQKVILDNIRCDEHQTKMTCLFCRTCDHLVCLDCISSKHNKHNFEPIDKILSEKLDELEGAEARYRQDLTLCQAKVEEFQFSETKFESLFDESITKIKEKEKVLIDGITKHSEKLQNERKTVKKMFSEIKSQIDKAEKTIIHHQDEIMAALKSIQGSAIFTPATKFTKRMSDLNFNQIPSEIKLFIPQKETVNDIPNVFGSLQKMKISQVQSDIDFEVVNSYTTDLSCISNIITVDDKST
jgi:tripartite motif-containing protein 56